VDLRYALKGSGNGFLIAALERGLRVIFLQTFDVRSKSYFTSDEERYVQKHVRPLKRQPHETTSRAHISQRAIHFLPGFPSTDNSFKNPVSYRRDGYETSVSQKSVMTGIVRNSHLMKAAFELQC